MTRIRENYDADKMPAWDPPNYPVDENRYPMPCSVCGNEFYVDKATIRQYECAVEYDADNTFVCRACEDYYEDLSHH
ncbi:MAG: hypothetical protein ACK4S4_00315 [Pyrinomonadaceae bacterium]